MTECRHHVLQLEPSPFAELAGYSQPSLPKCIAATIQPSRVTKVSANKKDLGATFPAPLVLPFDDLNYDPDCEPQDFNCWLQYEERNKVSASKQTVYIARVPEITKHVVHMCEWSIPNLSPDYAGLSEKKAQSPEVDDFIDYVSAFYHGMTVKELPVRFKWTSWEDGTKPRRKGAIPKYIALQHGNETTRVATRVPPDDAFSAQLNLNDILDGALRVIPADAYALCLLVDHDIWEEDDNFCCGRAYGGSRVCVVQTARYNPALDVKEGIDRAHMWPMSHCKDFVDQICLTEDLKPRKPTQRQVRESRSGPMRKAVDAAVRKMSEANGEESKEALWFSRLARTVTHELAHCFAFDHCVYYACNSQGTAGMREDVRQSPYLCPVCEAKISHAIVVEGSNGSQEQRRVWIRERCAKLQDFCNGLDSKGKGHAMWSGLDAWLEERMLGL